MIRKKIETLSALFSLNILINWGSNDTAVQMPAIMPITSTAESFIRYIFIMRVKIMPPPYCNVMTGW